MLIPGRTIDFAIVVSDEPCNRLRIDGWRYSRNLRFEFGYAGVGGIVFGLPILRSPTRIQKLIGLPLDQIGYLGAVLTGQERLALIQIDVRAPKISYRFLDVITHFVSPLAD
jgi:hypothetical protein